MTSDSVEGVVPADTVLQNLILISVGLSLCFVSPAFSLAYSRLERRRRRARRRR